MAGVSVQARLERGACRTDGDAVYPIHGTDRTAPAAGDLGRDPGRRPDADRCSARAHPRAGSPAGAELVELLPSCIYGPTPGPAAAESAAHGPEARRPARTPGHLPRAAARRASGRGGDGDARDLSALWAGVARSYRPPSWPSLAASGGGVAAAGR